MTEENKRRNIADELARGAECIAAADVLHKAGYINDAVSRVYYYLLHTVRALLLSKGLEPRSHESALRLFGMHFVKEQIFDPTDAHVFSRLMKYREEADYNPSYVFVEQDYLEIREESKRLAQKIQQHLTDRGYVAGGRGN